VVVAILSNEPAQGSATRRISGKYLVPRLRHGSAHVARRWDMYIGRCWPFQVRAHSAASCLSHSGGGCRPPAFSLQKSTSSAAFPHQSSWPATWGCAAIIIIIISYRLSPPSSTDRSAIVYHYRSCCCGSPCSIRSYQTPACFSLGPRRCTTLLGPPPPTLGVNDICIHAAFRISAL
jgi:hypothetical protein